MKLSGFVGLILLAGYAGMLFAASGPVNLIQNAGFENNPNGVSYGWSFSTNGDTAKAEKVIDSTSGTAKEGQNFCRLNVTAVSSQNWHVQIKDPTWPAKEGYKYHFSFWARADAEHTAQISVYGGADSKDTYRTSSQIKVTTEWQQFHQVFISDVTGNGKINFAFVCGFETGVYDFDDIWVVEEDSTGNLYANGDFEVGQSGWSLYLNSDSGSTAAAEMTFPTEGAGQGTKFCRINVTSITEGNDWHVQLQDGSWIYDPLKKYTITLLAKADAGQTINIVAQSGGSRNYAYLGGQSEQLTDQWTEYSYTYIGGDDLGYGQDSLNFFIYCGAETGVYDFDSVMLLAEELPVPDSNNVYQNGGFENGDAGWTLFVNSDSASTAAAEMSIPTEGAGAGTKFCRINVTSITEENNWHVQLQDGSWMYDSLKKYTITFLAKADAAQTINIAAQSGASRNYAYLGGKNVSLTDEWAEYTYTYPGTDTLGSGKDSLSFNIYCGAAIGVYDIDSVTLVADSIPISILPRMSMTAMKKNGGISLRVHPEYIQCIPVSDFAASCKASIYTVQGRLYASRTVSSGERMVTLPRPPSGIWIVRLSTNQQKVLTIP